MPAYRFWLFAPGNNQPRVEKSFTLGADVVVLYLENACPYEEKESARDLVLAAQKKQPD